MGILDPCPFLLRNRHGSAGPGMVAPMSIPKEEWTWVFCTHVHSSLGIDMALQALAWSHPCLFLRRNGHGYSRTHVHSCLGIDMAQQVLARSHPCLFLRRNGHGYVVTHVHSSLGIDMAQKVLARSHPCLFQRRNGHGYSGTHVHSFLGIDIAQQVLAWSHPCLFLRRNGHGYCETHAHSSLGIDMAHAGPGMMQGCTHAYALAGRNIGTVEAMSSTQQVLAHTCMCLFVLNKYIEVSVLVLHITDATRGITGVQ